MPTAEVVNARAKLPPLRPRLQAIHIDDIKPSLDALWLVHEMLPRTGIAMIYGESGSGKTYLATDIVLHVAAGMAWGGRRVHRGVVVYVAAENPRSVQSRVYLWRQERGAGDFFVIPSPINLLTAEVDELSSLLHDIQKEHGPIACVVVDTLARSMAGGDENNGQDMGRVIAACDRLRDEFSTLALLIHHSGKDAEKGARGHSSLKGGIDTEIRVTANGTRHTATITKQRDEAAGDAFDFTLRPYVLGKTADGEEVTACLVEELGEATAKQSRAALSPALRVALEALHDAIDETGQLASEAAMKHGARIGQTVAATETWRACLYARMPDDKQESKRQAFHRATQQLQGKGYVRVHNGEAWLT
ncbi:MAG TPA: AAA family ATPase [Gammaproteobacteria bacterium]|nr:AAA family ATPase [Gammaproteobacteria bacterium]